MATVVWPTRINFAAFMSDVFSCIFIDNKKKCNTPTSSLPGLASVSQHGCVSPLESSYTTHPLLSNEGIRHQMILAIPLLKLPVSPPPPTPSLCFLLSAHCWVYWSLWFNRASPGLLTHGKHKDTCAASKRLHAPTHVSTWTHVYSPSHTHTHTLSQTWATKKCMARVFGFKSLQWSKRRGLCYPLTNCDCSGLF